MNVIAHLLAAHGPIPNHPSWPLLIYPAAISDAITAEAFEQLFTRNRWPAAWRNGVFPFHHYHSNGREALGIYSGEVTVQFGTCMPPFARLAKSRAAVARVPLPACDPVHGPEGPLFTYWK